jgi:DNA-binding response OmpR family regulator
MSLVAIRRDWANFWRCLRDLWEEAAQPEHRAALVAQSLADRPEKDTALASALVSGSRQDGAIRANAAGGPIGAPGHDASGDGTVLRFEDLALDTRTRDVARNERSMELTPTEFRLLELLLRNPRQVLTRELIFDRVWGFDFGPTSNTLSVYIGYLRRKTEADGEPRLIHTVRGVGYMLRE